MYFPYIKYVHCVNPHKCSLIHSEPTHHLICFHENVSTIILGKSNYISGCLNTYTKFIKLHLSKIV